MKAAEVRAMNKADLEKKLSELKAELFKLFGKRNNFGLVRVLYSEHYAALLEYLEACRNKSLVKSLFKCLCYAERLTC